MRVLGTELWSFAKVSACICCTSTGTFNFKQVWKEGAEVAALATQKEAGVGIGGPRLPLCSTVPEVTLESDKVKKEFHFCSACSLSLGLRVGAEPISSQTGCQIHSRLSLQSLILSKYLLTQLNSQGASSDRRQRTQPAALGSNTCFSLCIWVWPQRVNGVA